MAAASDGENAIFPALGPTQMPLGLGQVALGSVLLWVDFHHDGLQEPCLAPAGEVMTCRSPVLSPFLLS